MSGVDSMMLQWSFDVVKYALSMETETDCVSLLLPMVILNLYVSLFWDLMSQTMRQYVTFLCQGNSKQ